MWLETAKIVVTALVLLILPATSAHAERWVEVGADMEAVFYVDLDSIEIVNDNVRVTKRGVYTNVLTESLGGQLTAFKETRGIVELDCQLRVNRVLRIDMLNASGEVVWTSGDMSRRIWLSVKPNSHAEATLNVTCGQFQQS